MFPNDLIRRRLVSLILPWLLQDPDIQLKLGLFCSTGSLINFAFNVAALNELLDDPSRICFEEVTVEELSLKFSPLSSAAFTLLVRGLRVVLSVGEKENERRPRFNDTTVEERNNLLREIDPEGCALHDAVKKISEITPESWRTSILKTIIRHCLLELHDVCVILKPHNPHDTVSCSMSTRKIGAVSNNAVNRSFLIDLMGSFVTSGKTSSFDIDVDRYEISLNVDNRTSCIFPATNMFAVVDINHLNSMTICVRVPAVNILLCPEDLCHALSLYRLFRKKTTYARPGRQLWNIVAIKLSSLLQTSNTSFVKVVRVACLWIRYINTYQCLLTLVGYPDHDKMKRSASLTFRDKTYLCSIKSQWKLISEIENDLPPEVIAVSRRIIRSRTRSNRPGQSEKFDDFYTNRPLSKVRQVLVRFWRMIGSFFLLVVNILLLYKVLAILFKSRRNVDEVHSDLALQTCISFDVEEISMHFTPASAVQSAVIRKAVSDKTRSYQGLLGFKLCVSSVFCRYLENITEQCSAVSVGSFNVLSFSNSKTSGNNNLKEHWHKEILGQELIVRSDPAESFYFPQDTDGDTTVHVCKTSMSHIDHLLRELWLNWVDSSLNDQGKTTSNTLTPWIICEVKSCLASHRRGDSSSSPQKCSLVIGKLNFNLDYYSLLSVVVLLKQTQHAFYGRGSRKKDVLNTPVIQDHVVRDWRSMYGLYSSKIEREIVRIIPEKHVEIGALIAGPCIHVSMSNYQFGAKSRDPYHTFTEVSFEIGNIELLVSPNAKDNVGSVVEDCAEHNRGLEYLELKTPTEICIPESYSKGYACKEQISLLAFMKIGGLKAYVDETSENRDFQIVELRSIITQVHCIRKAGYSFCSSIVAPSVTFFMVANGFSTLIFLDELHVLTKMFFEVSHDSLAFARDKTGDGVRHEELSIKESQQTPYHSTQQALFNTETHLRFLGMFELKLSEIVLHNSRRSFSVETHNGKPSADGEKGSLLFMHERSAKGICISVLMSKMDIAFERQNTEISVDTKGLQCVVLKALSGLDGRPDKSEQKDLLCSPNFLSEASVSQIKLYIRLFPIGAKQYVTHATSPVGAESSSIMETESLKEHWLFTSIVVSGIYLTGSQLKNILSDQNRFEEFSASISVGGGFQKVSYESKGGSVLLEVQAAVMLIECFTLYYQWILEHLLLSRSSDSVSIAQSSGEPVGRPSADNQLDQQTGIWDHMEELSVSLLRPSLTIVASDESGRFQELMFEADFHLDFKMDSTSRKLSTTVSRFSFLSRFMRGVLDHEDQDKDSIHLFPSEASGSSWSMSPEASCDDCTSGTAEKKLYRSAQNYVLKDLQCFLSVDRPASRDNSISACSSVWFGSGSISGFDMTISLTEIKMALSTFKSISKVLSREGTSRPESTGFSYNQGTGGSVGELVADGTIVAIQDVDKHMYIAVVDVSNGYDLAGVLHYSLAGERALFRVKHHKARRWESQAQYFSLISLYAKDNSGEALRLNSLPKSRLVDISCTNDSGGALWKMVPSKLDAYDGAAELEASTSLFKRTFHLVNRKNDCAVAFTDGILEFVSKPGNLLKWKVLDDCRPVGNNLLPHRHVMEGQSSPINGSRNDIDATGIVELKSNEQLLGITITVAKVTLTIVHELLDIEEKFPLLQGSIIPDQTIIQISNSKVRVMHKNEIIICYFDAQHDSWKEFIQPLELCTFYSQRYLTKGSETFSQGATTHLHALIKEVTVILSEHSLDTLLFVIGHLDLAGPYAVKSSTVLANCCKVDNQSALAVICQFYDNQDVSVPARQSSTIFLRHLALANQPPEASFFSLQLVRPGSLYTSPIHLSLLETQQFAWRTRVLSSPDSKSFPGPFIAVEISRGIEDGFSIHISPLLKICNETDFSMELRFQRPQHEESDSALLVLRAGDAIDDAVTAFGAIDSSGGKRKALSSVSVGNYAFSFRPNIEDHPENFKNLLVDWSDNLKGGKPVRLSGLFDKLSYQVRKAFSAGTVKYTLSSAKCAVKTEDAFVADVHFLVQTAAKSIPVVNPDNFGYTHENRNSPFAMQEQKEIYLLPTIRVSNLLHCEIHVSLTDGDSHNTMDHGKKWSEAVVSCGSAVNFYVDPAAIFFLITLNPFGSRCRPVNNSDLLKKLRKHKGDIAYLDIELDFGGGKYFAMLRLSRGKTGTLEIFIFTPYALRNDTDTPLFCFPANQRPLSRDDVERFGTVVPLELGSYLPPNSIVSWLLKCRKLHFKLFEDKVMEAHLDLDALSGLAEIDLESEEEFGVKNIWRLGVSLRPAPTKTVFSQMVTLNSRYVVFNGSEEAISVRQCYMENIEEVVALKSKERKALRLRKATKSKQQATVVENLLRKHTRSQNDLSLFIQFKPSETGTWSGPVCVASLGRFFLKFRQLPESQSDTFPSTRNLNEFAAVHVVEEMSTIILRFHRPPATDIPYRIENCLHDAPITYYQKGSSEAQTLGAGVTAHYVWDDLTLPRKLIVQLDDVHLLREINIDKVRSWKSFYRTNQARGLGFLSQVEKKQEDQKRTAYSRLNGKETVRVGYEVYAEGVARVLRICEFADSHKKNMVLSSRSFTKMRLRTSYVAVHLQEHVVQDLDQAQPSNIAPIIVARFERISSDSMLTNEHKYHQIKLQSLSVEEKWVGAPFAAMIRRHQLEKSEINDNILQIAVVLLPPSSLVKQVKYVSIVLQPLDLNVDEETLMKLVPFWRSSLSDSNTPRQHYYFDHFEIHPIMIVASFLPGDSLYSYSSTQETLRSLLHSVIKIPVIKGKTVELNGVLVTHALTTLRDLSIKCAQHYSWYAMRAIYIAKGSPLLPPAFASLFDDLASSSLDVFFDPSSGLLNLPGVTLGTLKLISKVIDDKGFSGTKRYFGDLGKTLKTAGSNVLFAAVTEVSDSVLRGAETSGFNGMVKGFHQGILKLAMEPSVLGSAFLEGGPDRKIKLDRSPGVDELYIEGYLQAMLDTIYKQEYLRVRVVENQVILKNLPPSSSLIDEIMDRVKGFLASKALLKGETSSAYSLRYMRGEREWRIGPTVLTLCEHLFVSFVIRLLRKQSRKVLFRINLKGNELKATSDEDRAIVPSVPPPSPSGEEHNKVKFQWKWGIGKFVLSGIVAYIDGRLCRNIPHPLARRIVSGFLLSFLDQSNDDTKK